MLKNIVPVQATCNDAPQKAAATSLNAIVDAGLEKVDITNAAAFLQSIGREIKDQLENIIATQDQLKFAVINSVNGFDDDGCYCPLDDEKRKLLVARGLGNLKEAFPEATLEVQQRWKQFLEEAVEDLVVDCEEAIEDYTTQLYDLAPFGDKIKEAFVKCLKKQVAVGDAEKIQYRLLNCGWKKLVPKAEIESVSSALESKITEIANSFAELNVDGRSSADKLKSFVWTNLLLKKSKQYAFSPMSGFMPSFVTIGMDALKVYLNRSKVFKSNLHKLDKRFANGLKELQVEFQQAFVCNPSTMRHLRKMLNSNKFVACPSIKTDGYRLMLSYIDNTKPKAQNGGKFQLTEISRHLYKNQGKASQIQTILAADEGVRYPIDVCAISMGGCHQNVKQRMRVRQECLYHYDNELSSKMEYQKSKKPQILLAEAELGSTGTKNSANWELFKSGYYSAWLKHQKLLFEFYSRPALRAAKYHCEYMKQKLYDNLVNDLFRMLGVQQHRKSFVDNSSKLVVLGQQQPSTNHPGHRSSKHCQFWKYFTQKARAIGVDVVGLVEYNSSKVCMECLKHVHHDKNKNYRVFYCETCSKHHHRDDSSAEIHCAVAWSEVIGYRQAAANGILKHYDKNNEKLYYFRPMLFRAPWMQSNEYATNNDSSLDSLAKESAVICGLPMNYM